MQVNGRVICLTSGFVSCSHRNVPWIVCITTGVEIGNYFSSKEYKQEQLSCERNENKINKYSWTCNKTFIFITTVII